MSVPAKLEIGRAMVKYGVRNIAQMALSYSPIGQVQIEFVDAAGVCMKPLVLKHADHIPGTNPPMPRPDAFGGHQVFGPAMSLNPGMQWPQTPRQPHWGPPSPLNREVQTPRISSMPTIPQIPSIGIPQAPPLPQMPSPFPELTQVLLHTEAMHVAQLSSSPQPPQTINPILLDVFGRNYMPGLALSLAKTRLENLDLHESPGPIETNLYRYAGNNPVSRIDPRGTDWMPAKMTPMVPPITTHIDPWQPCPTPLVDFAGSACEVACRTIAKAPKAVCESLCAKAGNDCKLLEKICDLMKTKQAIEWCVTTWEALCLGN